MGATGLDGKEALPLVRVRSRLTRADDVAAPGSTTPSLHTPVTVPFLWEDAPGKPKQHGAATASTTDPATTDGATATGGGDHLADGAKKPPPRLMPLKLPPRLQVLSTAATDHHSALSPKTVLHGPYYGGSARRPPPQPRRNASFRRTPSGGLFFSRRMNKKKGSGCDHDAAGPDTSCSSSPSPTSSSSSSVSFFFDDGARRRPGDQNRVDHTEEDGSFMGLVRITRFRRNRSFPSMTTSHLWASIRKSVKQIAPWT